MKELLNKLISAVLLASIIVAVGVTVYIASAPTIGERFTEFYILGPSGKAEGYPTNLTLGENGTVILGVVNHEYEEVAYRIVIRLNNRTIGTINDIILRHDAKWEHNCTFTSEIANEKMKLEFLLYEESLDDPYRSLYLWVTVHPREEGLS